MCMCTGELKFKKEKSVNKAILKFNLRVYFLLCCLFSPGDRSVFFFLPCRRFSTKPSIFLETARDSQK